MPTEPNTDAITNVTPARVDKVNFLPEGDHRHQNDGSSEIEKIIKQKQFSRQVLSLCVCLVMQSD
jgi:hypothetical protein